MQQYKDTLQHILDNGKWKTNRTGIKTLQVFGHQSRYDLRKGFPCLTTKKLHLKSIIHELLWFLQGDTNIKYLKDNGVRIWDEWADENGNLGPVYGEQWRNFGYTSWTPLANPSETMVIPGVDQIKNAIETLKANPDSRRNIISAWNPQVVDQMALPPCHCLFQFDVSEGKYLNCLLYQRSCDTFLGVPFNIASYALLTMMMAQCANLEPGEFIHTYGDLHIYENHMDQVKEQLSRECRPLPQMKINPDVKDIFDFKYEDFELVNYNPHDAIKATVAV